MTMGHHDLNGTSGRDIDGEVSRMVEVCLKHRYAGEAAVIVPEPYIPYVPRRWNGTLIVAEAQNLAGPEKYARDLLGATPEERVKRLYWGSQEDIGIGPWDDGTIKLAALSAWPDFLPESFAVSNAVLWSQRAADGRNVNPETALIEPSCSIWADLLAVLKPDRIVTVGAMAQQVMGRAAPGVETVRWASASPVFLNRIAWMFPEGDLLVRYPEVAAAARRDSGWLSNNRGAKIFYAAHALSTVSAQRSRSS